MYPEIQNNSVKARLHRLSAALTFRFNANFTFANQNLYAFYTNPCSAVFCKLLGDFVGGLHGRRLFFSKD